MFCSPVGIHNNKEWSFLSYGYLPLDLSCPFLIYKFQSLGRGNEKNFDAQYRSSGKSLVNKGIKRLELK